MGTAKAGNMVYIAHTRNIDQSSTKDMTVKAKIQPSMVITTQKIIVAKVGENHMDLSKAGNIIHIAHTRNMATDFTKKIGCHTPIKNAEIEMLRT